MQNNSLEFWMAFVQEYFAPGGYMRVTINGCGQGGSSAHGIEARSLGQLTWHVAIKSNCQCDVIMFAEAPLETLPRLFHIKYDSGLKEELLYLSDPQETETNSGGLSLDTGFCLHLEMTRKCYHATVTVVETASGFIMCRTLGAD